MVYKKKDNITVKLPGHVSDVASGTECNSTEEIENS